jgi:RNA polymerase sigma factor (sigma-70 family)
MTASESLAQAPPRAVLGDGDREAIRAAHAAARDEHGDLGLSHEAFEERVSAGVGRQGLSTAAAVSDAVRAAALGDLYLASACDAGSARAWSLLAEGYRHRLEGFARRRGLPSAECEAVVQDLFGDLSLPPPRPVARTLLGTYGAAGSLFGWLCVVLLRRLAARARGRQAVSLDALPAEGREAARARSGPGVSAAPPDALAQDETSRRFSAAIGRAWRELSPQERLALLGKHRDGLTQRRIGALLGVGEARVSRIVSAGVEKLAGRVRAALSETGGPSGEALWAALVEAVGSRLAREGPLDAPTLGATEASRAGTAEAPPGGGRA